ncbi:hypothetical protein niasHT_036066 [Heterodera trifolii]|uniref:Uncharacterized protein n=1 Tax=Heterodera trifolii TaxID=157864 RepID=A0ABD2IF26_9BILA
MFSLFRGAYSEMTRKDEFFVALFGLDGAGKTAYVERLKAHFDRHYRCRNLAKLASTVGLNHVRVPLAGAVLNMWDLGGQAELRPLWHSYLAECHAIVFVVDSSDVQRLPEVCSALESIFAVERVCQLPLMVLFNKCDLEGKLTTNDAMDGEQTPTISAGTTNPTAHGHPSTNCAPPISSPSPQPAPPPPVQSPALSSLCGSSGGWQSFELVDNNDHDEHHNDNASGADGAVGDSAGPWHCEDGTESEWDNDRLSTVTAASSSSITNTADRPQRHDTNANELMERFRRQYFNNHIATRHQADVAIFSVSALQNINVKRSVTWLLSALSVTQRHH